jgi:predicted GNAT family acetyltransferase
MPELAGWLREKQIDLPGVMGPKAASEAFAAEWSRQSACKAHLHMGMRTHQLRKVLPITAPPGCMRQATQGDFELLVAWAAGFGRDTGCASGDNAPAVHRCLESGGLWLWENTQPVAMANCGQPTPNGIRINWVYTPREHRCRGYATALVAQLSQHLLDNGRKFCFLFTDLANPTSNSIYRRIGYEGVCDYAAYHFV